MKKKNDFVSAGLSFEDFEKAMASNPSDTVSAAELIQHTVEKDLAAKKKESELKKAHQKRKRSAK